MCCRSGVESCAAVGHHELAMKRSDLRRSTGVDARWRILDETVRATKARNCDLSPEELEAEIELAVRQVRGELASHGRAVQLVDRAKRGDVAAALEFLGRAGGEPPRTGDERS